MRNCQQNLFARPDFYHVECPRQYLIPCQKTTVHVSENEGCKTYISNNPDSFHFCVMLENILTVKAKANCETTVTCYSKTLRVLKY